MAALSHTSQFVFAAGTATDANFRTWGKGISDMLASAGLTKTADTGQINWSTVLKPTTSPTSAGYEIWQFADALAATSPVRIKIEYGTAHGVDGAFGLWTTVGRGSDGAGNLSGTLVPRVQFRTGPFGAGTNVTNRVSGDSGRLIICQDVHDGDYNAVFGVERVVDAAGVRQGGKLFVTQASYDAGSARARAVRDTGTDFAVSPNLADAALPVYPPHRGSFEGIDGVSDRQIAIPWIAWGASGFLAALNHAAVNNNLARGSTLIASGPGGDHTYLVIRANSPFQQLSWHAGGWHSPTTGYAMLWE